MHSGAGMPKGAQGLQTTGQGQPEPGRGLVLLPRPGCSWESPAACSQRWLRSRGAASLRLCEGLVWEYLGKGWSRAGWACSSLAGNHSLLTPWAPSLPVPGAESPNPHLRISQALPDSAR